MQGEMHEDQAYVRDAFGLTLAAVGCPGEMMNMNMMMNQTPAKRVSKTSTVAISDDDATVAMVNPEDGSVSFFNTANNQKLATLKTGGEPSSVVIHPDNTTAFVANRADATVVKITGINTNAPAVAGTVPVGSEPTGLALSPSAASSSSPSMPRAMSRSSTPRR